MSGLLSLIGQALAVSSKPGGLFSISVRSIVRNNFPRANEGKRIKTHGWAKRMQTRGGQRIIMRRMLKGKYVYTH